MQRAPLPGHASRCSLHHPCMNLYQRRRAAGAGVFLSVMLRFSQSFRSYSGVKLVSARNIATSDVRSHLLEETLDIVDREAG